MAIRKTARAMLSVHNDKVPTGPTGTEKLEDDKKQFNAELAGLEIGRIQRFFTEGRSLRTRQDAKKIDDRFLLALTAYEANIRRLNDRITGLRELVSEKLAEAEAASQEAEIQLASVRARAVRDPSGRLVYRTQDGKRAFADDATQLSRDEFTQVAWRDGAPTWAEREAAGQRHHEAIERREALRSYSERLDATEKRLADPGVLSDEELKELERGIEAMPASLREMPGQKEKGPAILGAPQVREAFRVSHDASPVEPIQKPDATRTVIPSPR